ncbi:hypothetical protein EYZ11_005628 [Aspergillus tanneri]|uniref:Uncharacterized protein n=1 Tax=Aspergillus tanneri TaxID=1220188 RepID=A0A4S3JHI0_9EURO|nr:hypothetical protein EYZ11_005628 [Aspergillus tanneri]
MARLCILEPPFIAGRAALFTAQPVFRSFPRRVVLRELAFVPLLSCERLTSPNSVGPPPKGNLSSLEIRRAARQVRSRPWAQPKSTSANESRVDHLSAPCTALPPKRMAIPATFRRDHGGPRITLDCAARGNFTLSTWRNVLLWYWWYSCPNRKELSRSPLPGALEPDDTELLDQLTEMGMVCSPSQPRWINRTELGTDTGQMDVLLTAGNDLVGRELRTAVEVERMNSQVEAKKRRWSVPGVGSALIEIQSRDINKSRDLQDRGFV